MSFPALSAGDPLLPVQTALRAALARQDVRATPAGESRYSVQGRPLGRSVTSVVNPGGWWFAGPAAGAAREIGSAVHRACAIAAGASALAYVEEDEHGEPVDMGKMTLLDAVDADEAGTLPARDDWLDPFLEAREAFVQEFDFVELAVEVPLVVTIGGKAIPGTCDTIGTRRCWERLPWYQVPLVVVDYKTGAVSRTGRRQVAGYMAALWQCLTATYAPPVLGAVVGLSAREWDRKARRYYQEVVPTDLQDFAALAA